MVPPFRCGRISAWHISERFFVFSIYWRPWAHRGEGNTWCGLKERHGNRWLDAAARGPLFFVFFSPSFLLPDPMIPIWVSVRAAIHHWLDYLVGWEQRVIHLCGWHPPGRRDAVLSALPLPLMQSEQNQVLETDSHAHKPISWSSCKCAVP